VPDAKRWYGLAGLVVVLDQLSKWVVLENIRFGESIYVAPFWNWVLTYNPGAAFSFLADQAGWQRWFFTALALGVSGWIAVMLRQHAAQRLLALALALVMGGALGNVIDRVRFGAAGDFLHWHVPGYCWPSIQVPAPAQHHRAARLGPGAGATPAQHAGTASAKTQLFGAACPLPNAAGRTASGHGVFGPQRLLRQRFQLRER